MESAVRLGDAFDRDNVGSLGLHGQHVAGLHGAAVHMDGARAALCGVASDVGTCQAKRIADKVDEQRALFDLGACRLAVDGQGDLDGHDLTPSVKVEPFLGWRSNKFKRGLRYRVQAFVRIQEYFLSKDFPWTVSISKWCAAH